MRVSWGKDLLLVGALLGAGFVLAWARFRPYLGDEGFYSDGARVVDVARAEELRYAVWETPELLVGEVNSAGREGRSTRSADGGWLVFAGGERGVSADLFRARRAGKAWVDVEPVSAINTPFDEVGPHFSDGYLWFASNRPGGLGGLDLYRAPFDGERFGAVERLWDGVQSASDETDPALSPTGELAFSSDRGEVGRNNDYDLYLANGSDGGPWIAERVDALCSSFDEREPVFGLDGRSLLFASDRDGGAGGFDLYRAGLGREGWTDPRSMEGLCTALDERAPDAEPDGFEIRFVRSSASDADLFHAQSLELFHQPGRPTGWREIALLVALFLLAFLAWGARHWRAMDVLLRCYLVSLVAHLLIALWLQRVYPKPADAIPAEEPSRWRVRLVESPTDLAARSERAGHLEVERAAGEAEPVTSAPAPESERAPRVEVEVAAQDPGASIGLAIRERANRGAIAVPELESEAKPAREALGGEESVAVQAPTESFERQVEDRTGSFLRLEPDPSASSSAERSPVASALPFRPSTAPGPTPLSNEPAPQVSAPTREPRRESTGGGAGESALLDLTSMAQPSTDGSSRAKRELSAPAGPEFVAPESDPGERAATGLEVRAGRFERGPIAGLEAPVRERIGGSGFGISSPEATEVRSPEVDWAGREQRTGNDLGAEFSLEVGGLNLERGAPRTRSTDVVVPDLDRLGEEVAAAGEFDPNQNDRFLQSARKFSRPALGGSDRDAQALPEGPSVFHANSDQERGTGGVPGSLPLVSRGAPLAAAPDRQAESEGLSDLPSIRTPGILSSRGGLEKLRALKELGGTTETEAAVARGLSYLAHSQTSDGFWGSPTDEHEKYGFVAVGKTALVTLAFLGAGHTPGSRTEYSEVIDRAIRFLLATQGPESGHFGKTSAYSHAIATYALAEAFAMEPDDRLRAPLRLAVKHILEHQTRSGDQTRRGGWGYYRPTGRHVDSYPRTSITAWHVMALESARLGGIEVPDSVLDEAHSFLRAAWDPREGFYRYSHDPSRLRSGWPTLPGSTPAAMFALSVLGEDLAGPRFAKARDFILERMPIDFRRASTEDFVQRAGGNLYFVYYASLTMLRSRERDWEKWNSALQGYLLPSQKENGSWDPISIYARDYAGDDPNDLSYTTAMAVLCLEVYYRYFTPLLERNR